MSERTELLLEAVSHQRPLIFEVERTIWEHPETGFREWETHRYLAEIMRRLGYSLREAGEIPGFSADLETGRPGPKVLVMAELDGLLCPAHPEAVEGKAHACGHNAQCAALVGLAAALREPDVLRPLSGSVRLMFVPAEELIELDFREQLRREGKLRFCTGKPEFLARGMMDGCDLGFLFHGRADDAYDFVARGGANGCITKRITYTGKAAHAGLMPQKGINALYAATLGLSAVNALRETFYDEDHMRVHPIIRSGSSSVSSIPDSVTLESYVRGARIEAIADGNRRVNRALAGAAISMGAKVKISDRPGYTPLQNDPNLLAIAARCMREVAGPERVDVDAAGWITGSTDMGDLSAVMPVIHPYSCGASGTAHGADYRVADPERACVNSAKCQLLLLDALLENDAAEARRVVREARPPYASVEEFLAALEGQIADRSLVFYDEAGNATAVI